MAPKQVSRGVLSAGTPFRPLNHCPRADGRALGPGAGADVQGSTRKDGYSGQRRCILWPCQGQNGNPGSLLTRRGDEGGPFHDDLRPIAAVKDQHGTDVIPSPRAHLHGAHLLLTNGCAVPRYDRFDNLLNLPHPPSATMEVPEILRQMENNDGTFARAAVAEAVARRDEVVPSLLGILERVADDSDRFAPGPVPIVNSVCVGKH